LYCFRQVYGPAPCGLKYLFAAAKSIGDDQRLGRCLSHGWKKHAFSYGLRYRELLFLKPEGAGHAAASGVERLQSGPHLSE
jgi:hypothetical protein